MNNEQRNKERALDEGIGATPDETYIQLHMRGQFHASGNFKNLDLNPRQTIGAQQQREFPGVGQVMVEEPPDRLPN